MSAEQHGFKAEVQQLLNLMIHSVYSDREVFLRELVSNAADALDKARFVALTEPDLVGIEGDEPGIRVSVDAVARTLTVEDDGIGMTRDEVVENLGTIARSGTRAFLEEVRGKPEAPRLIGQFGLGFYASFMVADEVTVESLSARPGAEPVRWISRGEGTYTVEPGERKHRGTRITLKLREDAEEFLEKRRLEHIVRKHSNFVPWPVIVGGEKANSGKALWVEPPSQVTDEEANAFYKTVATDWRDPAWRIHFGVDTPVQMNALLFVPSQRPFDLFHPEAPKGPRLYARRVLIEEHARDLLPDWLRFVRGVVDSEDIPLNVSREMVQKTPTVKKMRDILTKRVLKELAKLAEDAEKYAPVWRDFGPLLEEGYYHDKDRYGDLILPLLRFNALSHDDDQGLMTLAEYKERMPEGQDTIWYLTAESRKAALASPHLEVFRKRGWDVLILTHAVEEWLVSVLTEYDGVKLESVARGELDLDDDGESSDKVDLSGFAPWMKGVLGDAVVEVRESSRLTDSACVLVDAEHGISANMERILRAANQEAPAARRVLELNPRHPLIKNLVALHEKGRAQDAEPLARLLLDDALLLEGTVKEPAAMGRRLQDLLQRATEAALAEATG